MSIVNILCKTCHNVMTKRQVDGKFMKVCDICGISIPCTVDEYVIKTSIIGTRTQDLVIYDSIRDDPCLPFDNIKCGVCDKIQRCRYIRNIETLKITHIICSACNTIQKLDV